VVGVVTVVVGGGGADGNLWIGGNHKELWVIFDSRIGCAAKLA